MPTSPQTLKLIRQIHLYIGIFIAPAVLFFSLTGALQTFSLHETTQGSTYKPPAWIVTLAQLHKKQTSSIPVRKPRPTAAKVPADKPFGDTPRAERADKPDSVSATPSPKPPPDTPAPKQKSHLPMKIFFLLVSIGLFTSTLTGIAMAYKYDRNKRIVTGLLLAGVVVPLLLLPF